MSGFLSIETDVPMQAPDMSPERMARILARVDEATMGRRASAALRRGDDKGYDIAFDAQMLGNSGLCKRQDGRLVLLLGAHTHEDYMPCLALHEKRHGMQPMDITFDRAQDAPFMYWLQVRLVEGDAFTHQVAFALDHFRETGKTDVRDACLADAKYRLPQKIHADFFKTCDDYLQAGDDANARRLHMSTMFSLIQHYLAVAYDFKNVPDIQDFTDRQIEKISNEEQSGAAPRSREELNVLHIRRMQDLPDLVGDDGKSYLADDPQEILAMIKASIVHNFANVLELIEEDALEKMSGKKAVPVSSPSSPALPVRPSGRP